MRKSAAIVGTPFAEKKVFGLHGAGGRFAKEEIAQASGRVRKRDVFRRGFGPEGCCRRAGACAVVEAGVEDVEGILGLLAIGEGAQLQCGEGPTSQTRNRSRCVAPF
jgi:hypothetical protein